eukprot:2619950-Prymnesium_polylepis.1
MLDETGPMKTNAIKSTRGSVSCRPLVQRRPLRSWGVIPPMTHTAIIGVSGPSPRSKSRV